MKVTHDQTHTQAKPKIIVTLYDKTQLNHLNQLQNIKVGTLDKIWALCQSIMCYGKLTGSTQTYLLHTWTIKGRASAMLSDSGLFLLF